MYLTCSERIAGIVHFEVEMFCVCMGIGFLEQNAVNLKESTEESRDQTIGQKKT